MHILVGSKAAWEVMPEGVIEFEQGPPREVSKSALDPQGHWGLGRRLSPPDPYVKLYITGR